MKVVHEVTPFTLITGLFELVRVASVAVHDIVDLAVVLLSLRVGGGCRMLMDRDTPIGEIAGALGYASSQAFSAQFKKYMGVSPKRFVR